MATFRGTDGNVTITANSVANIQSFNIESTRDVLDTTAMLATAKTKTLDIPDGRGRMTMRMDYDDTAQALLIDQALANAVPTALAAIFLMATGKTLTGNILISGASISSQVGQLVDLECQIEVTGGLSMAWA